MQICIKGAIVYFQILVSSSFGPGGAPMMATLPVPKGSA